MRAQSLLSNPTNARDGEKLATTARLTLDRPVDPQEKTRPPFSIDDGIVRVEGAALTGNTVAVADLAATFNVGGNFRGTNVLMPAAPELASGWNAVQAAAKKADDGVSLRKKLGVPKP